MLKRFFHYQTKTIAGAAGILALSAFVSRMLGVARDWLLAEMFGTGADADIYFAAFRVPDMVYGILIVGGIVVAFLPIFTEYFAKNKEEAWRFANNTLNIFFFLLIIFSLALFIFTPLLVKLITPGFSGEQLAKTIFLTRLMFFSPIFLGLSAIFTGILHCFNRFFIYSLAPVFYNLGIIFGLLFLAPRFGVTGVAIGVILGAFLHLAVQIPSAVSCGFKYQKIFNIRDPGVRRIFLLMIPRTLGVVGLQINLFAITAIASTLSQGSISVFNFSNNLQGMISGIIGVSFSMAVFPSLSRDWVIGAKDEFIRRFSYVFRQIAYIIIPLSILMFILRDQVVKIILEHGVFGQFSAQLTAASLGVFCAGIFAFSLNPLLARTFFSLQDTKTPTFIVFFVMLLNIFLSVYLTSVLKADNFFQDFFQNAFSLPPSLDIRVLALPLSYSFSVFIQFFLLLVFLHRKMRAIDLKEIFLSVLKIILSGTLMAAVVLAVLHLAPFYRQFDNFWILVFQTVIVALLGGGIYILATFLFKSPEAITIFKRINGKFNGKHS